jgi:hypothetical protein
MSDNDDRFAEMKPSQLLAEQEKRADKLRAAKDDGDPAKVKKAAAAVEELRTWQRSQSAAPADGTTANPDTVSATVKES